MDLPELGKSVGETKSQAKNLIPWLESPKKCDSCGSYTDATVEYVEEQAMPVQIWKCECGKRYYRNRE